MSKRKVFIWIVSILVILLAIIFSYFLANLFNTYPGNEVSRVNPANNNPGSNNFKITNGSAGQDNNVNGNSYQAGLENISGSTSAGSTLYGGRGAFLTGNSKNFGDKHYCENTINSTCISVLESVCGWFDSSQVSCSEGPCVRRYVSECSACNDSRVIYWTAGECPFHG